MDVDSIFTQICQDLEKSGKVKEISTLFSTFVSNAQRVSFVLQLEPVKKKLLEPLRAVLCQQTSSSNKSQELSTLHRSEGNQYFQKKLTHKAIEAYNLSVQFAAADSGDESLALAYANRSACLYDLRDWLHCLRDIQLAFDTLTYPKHLEHKLYERQGNCWLQLGNNYRNDAFVSFSRAKDALQCSKNNNNKERLSCIVSKLDKLSDVNSNNDPPPPALAAAAAAAKNLQDLEELLFASESSRRKPPELNRTTKNVQLPCASPSLRMAYSSEKGRCLVAVEDLQPGTRIIAEKAFASVLLQEYKESHCHHCLHTTTMGLIACHCCSQVGYCSARCRAEAWDSYHQAECRLLDVLHRSGVGKHGLLAFRTLIKVDGKALQVYAQDEEEAPNHDDIQGDTAVYDSSDYGTIHRLVGNTTQRTVADLFRRSVTAVYLTQLVRHNRLKDDEDDQVLVAAALLRLLQSYPCNAHEVSQLLVPLGSGSSSTVGQARLNEIGAAAMPVLSLINHSCDPNVVRHCYGDVLVVSVIRPIRQGEEILDNYGYHYATLSMDERRSKLRQQYFFDCACSACTHQWPLYHDISRLSESQKKRLPGVDALQSDLESFMQLTCSSAEDPNALNQVSWAGKFSHYITVLEHVRPVGDFNDAQEALKQSLALCATLMKPIRP